MTGDDVVELELSRPYDLVRSMSQVQLGPLDPSMKIVDGLVWRATRSPLGPATFRVGRLDDRLRLDAWGPGSSWVRDHAAALLGLRDDPSAFVTEHPLLKRLAHRFAGVHLPRTLRVLDSLVPTIAQQLVTWREAMRAVKRLAAAYGEAAPGPAGLQLLPTAATLMRLPPYAYAPLGAMAKQARTIREAATVAAKLETVVDLSYDEGMELLQRVRGIGPWTAAITLATAVGHADAVALGDLHLPHEICFALAREDKGDDARMLELLEPFAGHRGRAIALIRMAHLGPPRRGPRQAMRPIGW